MIYEDSIYALFSLTGLQAMLFSSDAIMFFILFFAHKKLKKPPSKVAHNRPKPFFPQPSPTHSQQPKIDFSYHKNVPPSVCSLVCGQNNCLKIYNDIKYSLKLVLFAKVPDTLDELAIDTDLLPTINCVIVWQKNTTHSRRQRTKVMRDKVEESAACFWN